VLFVATVVGPSFCTINWIATTTVAVAVSQFAGVAPAYIVDSNEYRFHLVCLLLLTLRWHQHNGPVVIGVTSVFAGVTKLRLTYHLLLRFERLLVLHLLQLLLSVVYCIVGLEATTVAVAVSQFAGVAPASHNW
jgi:hypothetical protein